MTITQGKQPGRAFARVGCPGCCATAPPTKAGGRRSYSPPSFVEPAVRPRVDGRGESRENPTGRPSALVAGTARRMLCGKSNGRKSGTAGAPSSVPPVCNPFAAPENTGPDQDLHPARSTPAQARSAGVIP